MNSYNWTELQQGWLRDLHINAYDTRYAVNTCTALFHSLVDGLPDDPRHAAQQLSEFMSIWTGLLNTASMHNRRE